MAEVLAGQPGVRSPGDDPGPRPAGRRRVAQLVLVALSAAAALNIADWAGVTGAAVVPDVARVMAVTVALFAVCGFGWTRLLLPAELRTYELLWVLPIGACACALELAVLGYLHVPFTANLAIVLAGSALLAAHAWGLTPFMRGSAPAPPLSARVSAAAWPLWIAALLACVVLIPTFRAGFLTVQGTGSDAHLATGTAHFLQDHPPTAIDVTEPIDRVPLVWRSKPPIYYPLAAVASLSGVATWEAFATVAAVLFALTALGFFLLARSALGASTVAAACAMAVVGLDRVALHTVLHPYWNQLWGFFALPFALVLAWWAVRARTRGAVVLLVAFLLVGAFAYPLALPIPLLALAALLWPERGRLRGLWRGRRSLIWMVPLAVVLLVPARGVVEKMNAAAKVVLPGESLRTWGGDLTGFIPEHQFLGMPSTSMLVLLTVPLLIAIVLELRRQPRALAWSLGAVLLFGAVAAAWFRPRDFGWYFHFKALAFVGPLALLVATVGVSRLRRFAWIPLAFLVLLGVQGARDETVVTFDQTPRTVTSLRDVDAALPPGTSVRLDVDPGRQLWVAYFLASQPLCSEKPLLNTSYPHVPVSRRADFALVQLGFTKPRDVAGQAVWSNADFALYRLRGGLPGPENCSQKMVQPYEQISVGGTAS